MRLIEEILDHHSSLRGEYLSHFTRLESAVDEILAHHFCNSESKHNLLCSSILKNTPFARKAAVFLSVLDDYDSKPMQELRSMMTDLESISKFRNKIAHLAPEIDVKLGKTLNFKYYENNKKSVLKIDEKDFQQKLKDLRTTANVVFLLDEYIRKANQTS